MTARKVGWFYTCCFLFVAGIAALGYLLPRTAFGISFAIYGGLFLIYLWLCRYSGKERFVQLLVLGICLRAVLLFSLPQWSDDFARFVWDGNLVRAGTNPYTALPSEFGLDEEGPALPLMEELLPLLNSPNYHSVYPPLNQLVFAVGAYLSDGNLLLAVLMIRLVLVGFEIWVFGLIFQVLRLLRKPPQLLFLYVLNPLVIMEITGNLHFEGMMLAFMLAGIRCLLKGNPALSGGLMGAAVAVKLTPLMLLPVFLAWLPTKRRIAFLLGFMGIAGLLMAPLFFDRSWYGFLTSLNLYTATFEFNASIYYVVRQVGIWFSGYNMIGVFGPLLKVLTAVLVLWISVKVKRLNPGSLFETLLIIYWIYFLLNNVVHPWYILPAFAISLFTERRAMMAWTFLIFLSYQAYGVEGFEQAPWLLGLEYLGVSMMLYIDYGKDRGRTLNIR